MPSEKDTLVDGSRPRHRPESEVQETSVAVFDREARRHARHELRTPLNQIIGYSELLIEDAEDDGKAEVVDDLRKIEAAGRRMVTLVDRYFSDQPSPVATSSRRPLSHAGLASTPSTRGIPTNPGASLDGRILVVDDDEQNRELLTRALQQAGYVVDGAESGEQAIARLEGESFDLVVLDVLMPDLSGLEVLCRIRDQYDAGDLPVVMATALDGSEDVVEALRLGANDYVTKPLDLQVVLARVATQLGLKQARDKVRELNHRLEAAQARIAALADDAPANSEDAATWARSIAREVEHALGRDGVVVWLFEGSLLVELMGSDAAVPSAEELRVLRRGQTSYRPQQALIAVRGQSDNLFGVLGVETGQGRFGQTEEHLVVHFARYLGSKLELGDMRRKLSEAAAQRRAAESELIQQGVDLLHLCPMCSRCYNHLTERCDEDGVNVHPPARPLPHKVARRYRLLRLVGEGGMGSVFRALDERLQREVALKLMKPEHFHNEHVRQRFETEARLVARLDHPSVIAIYDSGEAVEGSLFMVMEWLAGQDLGRILEEQGPGSPRQVVAMLRQAGSALSAAHAANLVHRDVKPENIFVQCDGDRLVVKVLDFGVAKELTKETGLTRTGSLIGTPLYMSPEQVTNRPVGASSDTYSLAAVAFEALTGQRTVTGGSFADVVLSVASGDAPRLSSVFSRISPELDDAFSRAFAKDPEDRPRTTSEWVEGFADALEAIESPFEWRFGECSQLRGPGPG